MKTKKHFIATLMLALTAFVAHADAKTDALIQVAKDNNAAEARQLIATGADVNMSAKDDYDETVLMYATRENSTDVAKLLLATGADMNAQNDFGETALMVATVNRATDIVELLKATGAL